MNIEHKHLYIIMMFTMVVFTFVVSKVNEGNNDHRQLQYQRGCACAWAGRSRWKLVGGGIVAMVEEPIDKIVL